MIEGKILSTFSTYLSCSVFPFLISNFVLNLHYLMLDSINRIRSFFFKRLCIYLHNKLVNLHLEVQLLYENLNDSRLSHLLRCPRFNLSSDKLKNTSRVSSLHSLGSDEVKNVYLWFQ